MTASINTGAINMTAIDVTSNVDLAKRPLGGRRRVGTLPGALPRQAPLATSGSSGDVRVGIVGTGYMARGLAHVLRRSPRLRLSCVLTRRPLDEAAGPWEGRVTHSLDRLIAHSDVVVITTGDAVHGTSVAASVLESRLPVITMDAELQVTAGSYLAGLGVLVEAQGDQPGTIALLAHEARQMGLTPLVYGNIKGFLNHNPTPDEMDYWARRQGISLTQVTSFTDGTKLQIEQALVANGLGATIARRGLLGPRTDTVPTGALALAEAAAGRGAPISDYVLPERGSPGVFVVATYDEEFEEFLRYYKVRLGDSPYVLLERPFHLCNLEIPLTIDRLLRGDLVTLNNGPRPRVSVAAVAKRPLAAGERIRTAVGGFQVRGEAVAIVDEPDHVPIALLAGSTVQRPVAAGETLRFADTHVPDSLALRAWRATLARAVPSTGRAAMPAPGRPNGRA
ncbi:SAF domain-containing protein [Frankia nepalensis]|uniref:SAF domain-containing protein n=1 Tax=Frankia nepalensis TaxID=1836974 RepID=UPI001EE3FD8E|nr:SAF domain-containing protein [Frankia nepalensis]